MDLKDIAIAKDDCRSQTSAMDYTDRGSMVPNGQPDLKKIEFIEQTKYYHPYSKPADKQNHLYRYYKMCQTSTARQDNGCHTVMMPHVKFDVNLPNNVLPVTQSFDTSPICCNTLRRNDMNEEIFICGACKLYFSSVCQLHSHLNNKHSPERYIFDFSIRTAFIEIRKVCSYTQTVLDEEELNDVGTEGYNEIKLESNVDVVDIDTFNQGTSDVSDDVATCYYDVDMKVESNLEDIDTCDERNLDNVKTDPDYCPSDLEKEYPSDSYESKQMNRKGTRKKSMTRKFVNDLEQIDENGDDDINDKSKQTVTTRQFVNNLGEPIDETRDDGMNDNTEQMVTDASVALDYDEDEMLDSSSSHTSSDCSEMSDDLELPSNTKRKATAKKKSRPSKSGDKCHNLNVCSKKSETALRKSFTCKWCKKTLPIGTSYIAHMRQCERNVNRICFICDQNFPSKSEVLEHLVVHKNAKNYECNNCQKSFTNEIGLQHHLRNHYKRRHIHEQCERCGKEFYYRALSRHLHTCNKDPELKCDQCGMMFKTSKTLENHKTTHSDDKPYICHVCGFAAKRFSYLTQHIRTHTGEKPFSCPVCGMKFRSAQGLNRHKLIHAEKKPCVCTYCEKSFTTNWNLKTHLRQHTGDTPYKCELCGKAFKQNVLLKLHLKSHP